MRARMKADDLPAFTGRPEKMPVILLRLISIAISMASSFAVSFAIALVCSSLGSNPLGLVW